MLSEAYSLSSKLQQHQQEGRSVAGRKADVQPFLSAADAGRRAVRIVARGHRAADQGGSYEEQEKTKHDWLNQFTIAFGTDEDDETTTFNGTIPQTLMMMNGDLIKKAIGTDKGSFLDRWPRTEIEQRRQDQPPVPGGLGPQAHGRSETTAANQLMALRGGDAIAALQDVWWALLNSNEFILNH